MAELDGLKRSLLCGDLARAAARAVEAAQQAQLVRLQRDGEWDAPGSSPSVCGASGRESSSGAGWAQQQHQGLHALRQQLLGCLGGRGGGRRPAGEHAGSRDGHRSRHHQRTAVRRALEL